MTQDIIKEVSVLARLAHPNIVQVRFHACSNGSFWEYSMIKDKRT